MKFDLHVHTNCSDGTDNWKEILQKCERSGIEYVSITDHNSCDAYFQMESPEKYFSGTIIKGVEVYGSYRGRVIELLGYGINVEMMRDSLETLTCSKGDISEHEYKQFYDVCVKNGMRFSPNLFENWDKDKYYYSGCYLHQDMKKYPENRKIITDDESWNNSIQFFRNYAGNPKSPFYINTANFYPPIETIFKIIKQAGGKVFIPHIFLYGDDSLPFLNGLTDELEIDGVECFYNTFTNEQTEFLLNFCKENNLLVSGGSDYHGANRPHINLGVEDKRFKREDINAILHKS
jgi:hypothetical protein